MNEDFLFVELHVLFVGGVHHDLTLGDVFFFFDFLDITVVVCKLSARGNLLGEVGVWSIAFLLHNFGSVTAADSDLLGFLFI